MAMNHSQAIWGPDADEFKPERWLSSNLKPLPSHMTGWYGQYTFSWGQRMCLGMRMGASDIFSRTPSLPAQTFPYIALFEYKIMLSALLKAFEFMPPPSGESIETYFSTLGTMVPFVIGKRTDGPKVPLAVRCIS